MGAEIKALLVRGGTVCAVDHQPPSLSLTERNERMKKVTHYVYSSGSTKTACQKLLTKIYYFTNVEKDVTCKNCLHDMARARKAYVDWMNKT